MDPDLKMSFQEMPIRFLLHFALMMLGAAQIVFIYKSIEYNITQTEIHIFTYLISIPAFLLFLLSLFHIKIQKGHIRRFNNSLRSPTKPETMPTYFGVYLGAFNLCASIAFPCIFMLT